jgi:Flp pilus assembly pilin Flp
MFQTLLPYLKAHLDRLTKNEKGETMVEYSMLIVLVGLAVFLASPNIKSGVIKVFQNTSSALR